MKARTVAVGAVAAGAVAGLILWRRRSRGSARPLLQLGLGDGSVETLAASNPSTAELESLAAAIRRALEGER